MALHWLALVIATLCISSQMHSVQSQLTSFNPFRHSKWGVGACPSKVSPMKDFDITRLYGQQWFLIAHYFEGHLLDRHCTSVTFSDANPGADICRVSYERTSIEYDDGERKVAQYFMLLPNETDHATWIDTLNNVPTKQYILATDYDKYLLVHECNQFPRDNPFLYEQHNYIMSTQAVWEGGMKDVQGALGVFDRLGIDTGPFTLHDQADCGSSPPPGGPEPLLKRLFRDRGDIWVR